MSQLVQVKTTGGNYPIHINAGDWDELVNAIVSQLHCKTVAVASDQTVAPLYADALAQGFESKGLKVISLQCLAGESSKSVQVLTRWWEELATAKVDRKAVVIAVGGGVVGDLAGFLAATHLRGLRFVQVPTTLLAQVDSSVGGKVGINLPQGKNLVGSFWQPELVWIDTSVLSTLNDREYSAGLAEVVKYAVIIDSPFFDWLSEHSEKILHRDTDTVATLIERCCRIKAQVVEEDTLETTGRRAILNFGHTVGHAIENLSGYGVVLHGEAIAMGMVAEAKMSQKLGKCQPELVKQLAELLTKFRLPVSMPDFDFAELKLAMMGDKKNTGGKITFVLPSQIGKVFLCNDAELNSEIFD